MSPTQPMYSTRAACIDCFPVGSSCVGPLTTSETKSPARGRAFRFSEASWTSVSRHDRAIEFVVDAEPHDVVGDVRIVVADNDAAAKRRNSRHERSVHLAEI